MIDTRVAGDQIEALLRSEIDDAVMQGFRAVIDPEVRTPPGDTRVSPYWILWAGPGQLNNDRGLVVGQHVSTMAFIVTVAGGTEDRALFGIGLVRAALVGAEIASGLISEDPFVDPGALRIDKTPSPWRQFMPLSYRLEP